MEWKSCRSSTRTDRLHQGTSPARGFYQRMRESGEPCVYLDISHRPAEQIRERFTGIMVTAYSMVSKSLKTASQSFPPRTTVAAGSLWTNGAGPACLACAQWAKSRAPV